MDNGVVYFSGKDVQTVKEGFIMGVNGRIDLEDNKVYMIAVDSSSGYGGKYYIKNRKVYNYNEDFEEFFKHLEDIAKENNISIEDIGQDYAFGQIIDMEKEALSRTFQVSTSNIEDITWWN